MKPKSDAQKLAEADQAMAVLAETFPQMLWRFFVNAKEGGFTEEQALELTREVLRGLTPGGK